MNRVKQYLDDDQDQPSEAAEQAAWVLVGTLSAKLVRDFSSIVSIVASDTDQGPHWIIMFKYSPALVNLKIPFDMFLNFFAASEGETPYEESVEMGNVFFERNYDALRKCIADMEDEMIEDAYPDA